MLYLGLYLSPYSILVTASLGGVYIYSYYSRCGDSCGNYYSTLSTAGSAIGTTSGAVVKIASEISKDSYKDSCGHYYRHCCGGYYRGSYKGYYGGNIGLVSS